VLFVGLKRFRGNPEDPLSEPAVVLVDEVDLHLHPTCQRKLMDYLGERFPNTQFIFTANSPVIAEAARDANIAVCRWEGDRVVIDGSKSCGAGMQP
jgi:predicted ATP-binding protein involved in virulence